MTSSRARRVAAPVVALVIVAGGGAWALNRPADGPSPGTGGGRLQLAEYATTASCPELLDRLRALALPRVTAYGLQGAEGWGTGWAGDVVGEAPAPGVAVRAEAAPAAPAGVAVGTASAPRTASAPGTPSQGSTSATGTNVQVAGVDEADVTKRAGDLVLTVANSGSPGLVVLRTAPDGTAKVVGRLRTDWAPAALLVEGSTVLLFGSALAPGGAMAGGPYAPGARPYVAVPRVGRRERVAQVDVADPAHPRLVRTLDVDGSLVGARLAGGVLRLSIDSPPDRLPFVAPRIPLPVPPRGVAEGAPGAPDGPVVDPVQGATVAPDTGTAVDVDVVTRRALAANRAVVRDSTIDQWLPRWTLTAAGGGAQSHGPLLDCTRIGLPGTFSGLGTLAMLTVDLRDGGIDRWDGAGVVASGATLYSTGDRSYVATAQWPSPQDSPQDSPQNSAQNSAQGSSQSSSQSSTATPTPQVPRTLVHAFATGADGVRYLGSGAVDGTLIGSSALDEYQGRLRVATTTQPFAVPEPVAGPVPAPAAVGSAAVGSAAVGSAAVIRPARSSSEITVLELRDGQLVRVGRLQGLGTTEVIHAVRFAGPVGYVVTFRQTDPLYTLDLADPAHPRVAGELKLLGYSAYLHPLDGGLLLGVGQSATADGVRTGLQMSLFDVADPAHPELLDRVALPGSWAATEQDPHAFTYSPTSSASSSATSSATDATGSGGGLALVPAQGSLAVTAPDGSVAPSPPQDAGGGSVVAVRVEGRSLAAPRLLHLHGGAYDVVDVLRLRTFADGPALWAVAPGDGQGLITGYDATTLRWLATTRF